MTSSAVGLQTHIWNNNIKSIMLLAGFPVLLLLMILGGSYAYYYGTQDAAEHALVILSQTWHIAFIVAGVWFVIAFLFHQNLINMASGARFVTRQEQPKIYNLLENLCISRGITMPGLAVIDTPMLNAFASGISDKNYVITLTQGLINTLTDEELEAVIGHELTHIINKDVRLMIVCVIFVGMISFFAEMSFRSMNYSRISSSRDDDKKSGKGMIIAAIVLLIGYILAILLRFSISRKREYLADAGSVELTKNPDAMISALEKISGKAVMKEMPEEVAQMCIENASDVGFMGIFATHPPIEDRINALKRYAGGVSKKEVAEDIAADNKSPWG